MLLRMKADSRGQPLSEYSIHTTTFRVSDLFDEMVTGLISAQKSLDEAAIQQRETFLLSSQGCFSIPPLWFHFRRVRFDLEVKALALEQGDSQSLTCQLINPVTSSLIETSFLTQSRISIVIEPSTQLFDKATG